MVAKIIIKSLVIKDYLYGALVLVVIILVPDIFRFHHHACWEGKSHMTAIMFPSPTLWLTKNDLLVKGKLGEKVTERLVVVIKRGDSVWISLVDPIALEINGGGLMSILLQ